MMIHCFFLPSLARTSEVPRPAGVHILGSSLESLPFFWLGLFQVFLYQPTGHRVQYITTCVCVPAGKCPADQLFPYLASLGISPLAVRIVAVVWPTSPEYVPHQRRSGHTGPPDTPSPGDDGPPEPAPRSLQPLGPIPPALPGFPVNNLPEDCLG